MIEDIVRYLTEAADVRAVVLSGSRGAGLVDTSSDWDLYVYADQVDLTVRKALAEKFAHQAEVGNTFFEDGDELLLPDGVVVDLMYRTSTWIEEEVARTWIQCQARVGYTTAFIHNIQKSVIYFDPTGWFRDLQRQVNGPYPAPLKHAIIAKNYPLLRTKLTASYTEQIKKAIERGDQVSVMHRVSALLASYFDVLFALNEVTHPGEKRLVTWAQTHCRLLPNGFAEQIEAITMHLHESNLVTHINKLLDSLDRLFEKHHH